MSEKAVLSGLEQLFKSAKWKKVSGTFYKDLNAETLAYFNPFFKGELLRVQFQVANRTLNRVAWDLYGIAPTFGTPKQQLITAIRCNLYFALDAIEIPNPTADPQTADRIGDICVRNAERFDSIDKIHAFLEAMPPEKQQHVAADRLCVALARGDHAAARTLVATAEREHIGFDLSIFAHAKHMLGGE